MWSLLSSFAKKFKFLLFRERYIEVFSELNDSVFETLKYNKKDRWSKYDSVDNCWTWGMDKLEEGTILFVGVCLKFTKIKRKDCYSFESKGHINHFDF